jgi:23S rRNA pseudouridine1911/1915/1917 synthase
MAEKLVFRNIESLSVREFLESFHISNKMLYKLKNSKAVSVNSETIDFNYLLKSNDCLTIEINNFEKKLTNPYDRPLDIIFEDEDILLVRKPPGILVHPDGNDNHTLDNIVSYHYLKQGIRRTVRHCHRLDVDTGGLILYAKHFLASAHLNYQIEKNLLKKRYYALVLGKMENTFGTINLCIGKNRHENNRYLVSKSGKSACTKYRVLKSNECHSLLEVEIFTGRRHQIRVHLKHIGHPIVGDSYYGKKGDRFFLEAFYLSFLHPRNKKQLEFQLPLPDDFKI